jgi:hypothetical protein
MNASIPTDSDLHDLCKVSHLELGEEIPAEEPTMTIKTLQTICCEQMGSLTENDLNLLAAHCPEVKVGFKMGYGSRFVTTAGQAKSELQNNFKAHAEMGLDQYVRECFIPATELDLVNKFFGWKFNW